MSEKQKLGSRPTSVPSGSHLDPRETCIMMHYNVV